MEPHHITWNITAAGGGGGGAGRCRALMDQLVDPVVAVGGVELEG